MKTCQACGCAPCACASASILNQPQIIQPTVSGGTFANPTIQNPTITNGTITGTQLVGAQLDDTSTAGTQPAGDCSALLSTTQFVCTAIANAVNSTNPAFCAEVQTCVAGSPSLCADTLLCINNTVGALTNPLIFDPAVFATTLQVGVARFATLSEVDGSSCLVAIDPCTLQAFWDGGGPSTLWTSFENAVTAIAAGPGLCAAVLACGLFAPLASPVFTGDPQAPTPAIADNDTSIATTAWVQTELTIAFAAQIAPTAAFCTAASGCGFAPLASPVFTGIPAAPTAAPGTNTTQLATTAYVDAAVAGGSAALFFSSVTVGNVAATETDAYAHALAGGTLSTNGDAIEFEAGGTIAATASTDKRIRVYLGATVLFDSAAMAIITAEDWHLTGSIVRTGAAAQKSTITLTTSDGTIQAIADYAVGALDLSLPQTIKLTIIGTNANDVVAEIYRDRYVAA